MFLIVINNLPNDIKTEIKIFADDVKLHVRPLSKETTLMDLNKLTHWEKIWKLGFNIENHSVLHIGCENIPDE